MHTANGRRAPSPNRFERILLDAGYDAYADASARARYDVVAESGHERAIRDVIAGVAAPILYSFVRWTLINAETNGIRRLYFVARDGELLLDIARACPGVAERFDLRYLYGSRSAWYLAGVDAADLAAESWLVEQPTSLTPRLLLDRLGLNSSDVEDAGDPDRRLDAVGTSRLLASLHQEKANAKIVEQIRRRRVIVRHYLEQEGMADGVAAGFVDLGWTGRMYSALSKVFAEMSAPMPAVSLLGLVRIAHVPFCQGWLFDTHSLQDVPLHRIAAAMETFCLSEMGHVTGYVRRPGEGVVPTLNYRSNSAAQRWGLSLLRKTAATVVAYLTDAEPLDPATAIRLLAEFWNTPTPAEARSWRRCPYEDDLQAKGRAVLATPPSLGTVIHALAYRDPSPWTDSCWPAGAWAATPATLRSILRVVGCQPAIGRGSHQ